MRNEAVLENPVPLHLKQFLCLKLTSELPLCSCLFHPFSVTAGFMRFSPSGSRGQFLTAVFIRKSEDIEVVKGKAISQNSLYSLTTIRASYGININVY
jgi:hypothetical protein